jgi:elongation factor G
MEVRTICLAGHAGSGKTALAEAIMKKGGIEAKFDISPEAKAKAHSIDLGVGTMTQGERHLQILDTPGFAEFIEEVYKGVRVCDLAILVVNAEKGVEVQTEKCWDIIRRAGKPALVLINKMDLPNADWAKALDSIREKLEGNFVLLEHPIREGDKFVGVVDLINNKASYFDKRKPDIPSALAQTVKEEREMLIEALADGDETVMTHFLEGQEIPPEEARNAFKMEIEQHTYAPVIFSSVPQGAGLDLLLEIIQTETPAFEEMKLQDHTPGAFIFNITSDQYLGKLAFVKIYGGTLNEGDVIYNITRRSKDKIKEILRFHGDKHEKIPKAGPGEIVALTKLTDIHMSDTLATSEGATAYKPIPFPKPIFARSLHPETQHDEEKMGTALKELVSTKATITYSRDEVTHEEILSGLGDIQLSIFSERLKSRYGVTVKMNKPKVPYKETIQAKSTGQYKHKKQSGGRGQYGEVHLRVEPRERGSGFEFADEVKGGVIPNQFIPAVEKGIVECLPDGVISKYPMTDIRAAAFYGSYHDVDSSEIAFKIAASQAFKNAVLTARPVLLEPVMKLLIWTPSDFTGDIISSLNGKRGRIHGMGTNEDLKMEEIDAEAPLAEILDYALELKSITQGRATYQMEFLRYQPVSNEKLTEDLLKREGRQILKHAPVA